MNKEKNEFEELLLENEKLEPIERRKNHSIKIPMISVYNLTFGFNEAAAKIVPDYIKWYKTREYIIGLPTTEFDKDNYPVRKKYEKLLCCNNISGCFTKREDDQERNVQTSQI